VNATATAVVEAGTPWSRMVSTLVAVPAADPPGTRWLTRKAAIVTSVVAKTPTRCPISVRTFRYSRT